jgi:hypothetical protein
VPLGPDAGDAELLWVEAQLRQEADAVAADLRLDEQLRHIGQPVRVGSAALGLLAHRDLDVTVVCAELDESAVVALSGWLALQPFVRQVVYRDDTALWNDDPDYPDGLYLGVKYCRAEDREWNVDVWFVDEPQRQPDLNHLGAFGPRIDYAARVAILRIKHRWAATPHYGREVSGIDVYRAVLDDGVRTPEQFDGWLAAR